MILVAMALGLVVLVAVVLYLFASDPPKRCPRCAMEVPEEAEVCAYCGQEFDPE